VEPGRVLPRVVLMCHAEDRIDTEGLAAWIASSMRLAGIVILRETPVRKLKRVRSEIRRVGPARFLDVIAFRAYYRLRLARSDAAWIDEEVRRLRARYPACLDDAATLEAAEPGTAAVRSFVSSLQPDLMIARCKFILGPEVFRLPRCGTFVLHPGICPEYRNAHGCFWALANRDLARVGMTLLEVDEGIDTGRVLLQSSYDFDEVRESHVVIQYRAVLENLDAIAGTLISVCEQGRRPISVDGRRSAVWGQPWLSAYRRWKSAARRLRATDARGWAAR
jgi:folate-dependent phosphoribosylglycinamide formyltransferase PurN